QRPSHCCHGHWAQDARTVKLTTVQDHLTVDRQVVSSRKQTCVPGHSTHAKRSGIVHLAAQPLLTLGSGVRTAVPEIVHLAATLFSWRRARYEVRIRAKPGVTHAERRENIPAREFIEHLSADAMHHFTKRDVIYVAVNEARSR